MKLTQGYLVHHIRGPEHAVTTSQIVPVVMADAYLYFKSQEFDDFQQEITGMAFPRFFLSFRWPVRLFVRPSVEKIFTEILRECCGTFIEMSELVLTLKRRLWERKVPPTFAFDQSEGGASTQSVSLPLTSYET